MTDNSRRILLASFVSQVDDELIEKEVHYILENMTLSSKYIFLFRNLNDPVKHILTYNVSLKKGEKINTRLYTMRVHRKKQSNTLYTINALNLAVAQQHGGETGRHLRLDWSAYENSILLASGKKLLAHPLEVVKIFKIEDPPEEN